MVDLVAREDEVVFEKRRAVSGERQAAGGKWRAAGGERQAARASIMMAANHIPQAGRPFIKIHYLYFLC
jgi:hypothetical protein